jgi:hypothetical protein
VILGGPRPRRGTGRHAALASPRRVLHRPRMTKRSKPGRAKAPRTAVTDVDPFLAACTHPLVAELVALRAIVGRAAPELVEGVKWNAPSYRLPGGDDVLTFNLSAPDRVRLIFHRGARTAPRARASAGPLADDGGLLAWPAPDRAVATFRDLAAVRAAGRRLAASVRAWLTAVSGVSTPAPARITPRASTGPRRGSSERAAGRAARGGSGAARGRRR